MNIAEWIIVGILAGMLLAFLIVGIICMAKVMGFIKRGHKLADEAEKVVIKGQEIAETADDILKHVDGTAANIEDFSSIGGMLSSFVGRFLGNLLKGSKRKRRW